MGLLLLAPGCATSKWVALRSTPRNPLTESLGLLTRQGPKPTERTLQLLRRYNLHEQLDEDRGVLLAQLDAIESRSPNRENVYAQAELAYVAAKKAERSMQKGQALEYYGAAVLHSYRYLFDERYAIATNPYDPEFRRACDLYNAALEGTLRIVQDRNSLQPDTVQTLNVANHTCQINIRLESDDWQAEDIDHFEFVSDYEVHGLRNHYHNFGLGVPLIAVRRKQSDVDPREEYYPEDLSFPVTAFLRVDLTQQSRTADRTAVLELYDPLNRPTVKVAQQTVPLETDLSTPLAHTLSQPALDDTRLSTVGLLKPDKVKQVQGLYMLEPFQEDKIPVLMVHGLWSSPVTWMEMFNDLRSDPQIRKYYQFWFYLYPTGQPFWLSAAQMRQDLGQMRQKARPGRPLPGVGPNGSGGPQHGGLGLEAANRRQRQRFLVDPQRPPLRRTECRGGTPPGFGKHLLLCSQSLDPPRDHDWHPPSRQRVFQRCHPVARQKADSHPHQADAGQARIDRPQPGFLPSHRSAGYHHEHRFAVTQVHVAASFADCAQQFLGEIQQHHGGDSCRWLRRLDHPRQGRWSGHAR